MITRRLWTLTVFRDHPGYRWGMVFCFPDQSQRKKETPKIMRNVMDLLKTEKAKVPGICKNGEDEEK